MEGGRNLKFHRYSIITLNDCYLLSIFKGQYHILRDVSKDLLAAYANHINNPEFSLKY